MPSQAWRGCRRPRKSTGAGERSGTWRIRDGSGPRRRTPSRAYLLGESIMTPSLRPMPQSRKLEPTRLPQSLTASSLHAVRQSAIDRAVDHEGKRETTPPFACAAMCCSPATERTSARVTDRRLAASPYIRRVHWQKCCSDDAVAWATRGKHCGPAPWPGAIQESEGLPALGVFRAPTARARRLVSSTA